jgi:hypothetical protein
MDYEKFKKDLEEFESWDDSKIISMYNKSDAVNSPSHYTRGSTEAIDII